MTILTALRTAATSAVAAKYLAPAGSRSMAIIGNGAQSEFQALGFKALIGVDRLRLYDIDRWASEKCAANLARTGFDLTDLRQRGGRGRGRRHRHHRDRRQAVRDDPDRQHVGAGAHINAVGGDCPGKTELHRDILLRSEIFVEYPPQTRVEGEIQQLAPDHPVTELWRVIAGEAPGRRSREQITLFDSVGFAIEDFSALRYVHSKLAGGDFHEDLDLLADPDEPRDLLGMVHRAETSGSKLPS